MPVLNLSGICLSCLAQVGSLNPCPHCGCDRNHLHINPQHLPPGTVLGGNFLIGKALGQGGFGITYLALDLQVHRIVAIKEYFPNGHVTRQMNHSIMPVDESSTQLLKKGVKLFFKEALMLANFSSSPNIVNVHHFFRENNTAYIVMEYINGKSLKDYLTMRGGCISFQEASQVLCPIMSALSDLHKSGLLHRDISPDNIYLTANGQSKLLDFGAARFVFGNETISESTILKPGYAPLEQYTGFSDNQGPWTDIYAMGATFYRTITGQLPIPASERALNKPLPSPQELGTVLPESADHAIMNAMRMDPEERYDSISEFEADIRRAVQPIPQPEVPLPKEDNPEEIIIRVPVKFPRKFPKKKYVLIGTAIIFMIVFCLIFRKH